MPTEVSGWLETYSKKYEERGSSPRARTLRIEMLKSGGLLHNCSDGSLQDDEKLFNWLKKRHTYQNKAFAHLAAYAAHSRELRLQQNEIGPGAGTGFSGGA
jgi:hypothetical protein